MELYQVLCLFSVPSVLTGIVTYLFRRIKDNDKQTNAVKLGVQALLRSQMINDYNRWIKEGYAPIYARENFENVWEQYHNLGANGVMNDIHNKFMALPTEKSN